MAEPIDVVWSWVEKIGHRGIDHLFNRLDKAAGLTGPTAPANPLAGPLPPALAQGIPDMPSIPDLPAIPPASHLAIPPLSEPQSEDNPGDNLSNRGISDDSMLVTSYALDVAAGTACANCLRGHLGTMVATAARLPDRAALARISAEYAVLMRYDLTPAKITATPEPQRTVVDRTLRALAPVGEDLRQATLAPMALTWGACDEAIRFARSHPRTTRDQDEIALRLVDVDQYGGYVERVVLAPENRTALARQFPDHTAQDWAEAAKALREARHVLDADPAWSVSTLEQASAWYAQAAVILTPRWTPAQVTALQDHLTIAQQTFYRAFLASMQAQKMPAR